MYIRIAYVMSAAPLVSIYQSRFSWARRLAWLKSESCEMYNHEIRMLYFSLRTEGSVPAYQRLHATRSRRKCPHIHLYGRHVWWKLLLDQQSSIGRVSVDTRSICRGRLHRPTHRPTIGRHVHQVSVNVSIECRSIYRQRPTFIDILRPKFCLTKVLTKPFDCYRLWSHSISWNHCTSLAVHYRIISDMSSLVSKPHCWGVLSDGTGIRRLHTTWLCHCIFHYLNSCKRAQADSKPSLIGHCTYTGVFAR